MTRHTIEARMKSEGSTKGTHPDRDRLVWMPRPLGGPAGTPIMPMPGLVEARPDGTVGRAGRRAITRAGRKDAERLVARDRAAGVELAKGGRLQLMGKGRRKWGDDLTRAKIRHLERMRARGNRAAAAGRTPQRAAGHARTGAARPVAKG